jgi:hypothetical protein
LGIDWFMTANVRTTWSTHEWGRTAEIVPRMSDSTVE